MSSDNLFIEEFKKYKQRVTTPNMDDVIDFDLDINLNKLKLVNNVEFSDNSGILDCKQWDCFSLENKPGFLFIRNPFSPEAQRYWMERCIHHYPKTNCISNASDGDINLSKLRWITLGYHFNWTTKRYERENFSPMPSDLVDMAHMIASAVGYQTFEPQTAIINYYHSKSTLAGHSDNSEHNTTAPIISVSFGQDAIFLLGGDTKRTKPQAMLVRSGDIVILGGSTRFAYHSVPRIIASERASVRWMMEMDKRCESKQSINGQNTDCDLNGENLSTDESNYGKRTEMFSHGAEIQSESNDMLQYLSKSRINLSIRQVYD